MLIKPKEAWCEIDVWNPGHGTPVMSGRGGAFYDILDKSIDPYGFVNSTNGQTNLYWDEDIKSLRCRAFPKFGDTRKMHWSCSPDASWDEIQPVGYGDRLYRLRMFDSTPTITEYSAVSNGWTHPPNPNFLFELYRKNPPIDWDHTLYPAYLRVELGGGMWGVMLSRQMGTSLQYNATPGNPLGWVTVKRLPSPGQHGVGFAENDAIFMAVLVDRGAIGVSFNFDDPKWFKRRDGLAVNIPGGSFAVRGRGGIVSFGLHGLDMYDGIYQHPTPFSVMEPQPFGTSALFAPRQDTLYGSSVDYLDVSDPVAGELAYEMELHPVTVASYPIQWKHSPSVYAVATRFEYSRQITGDTYTQPFANNLLNCDIELPMSLAQATATFRIRTRAHLGEEPYSETDWKYRKIRIRCGYTMTDNSETEPFSWIGYIDTVKSVWSEKFDSVITTFTVISPAEWFNRRKWGPHELLVFDGLVPNAAIRLIAKSEGWMDEGELDGSMLFLSTINNTELTPIDWGRPEKPHMQAKPNEPKLRTMQRIMDERDIEVGMTNDERLWTLPKNFIENDVTYTFKASSQNSTDIREQLRSIERSFNSGGTVTAVIAYGEDPSGRVIMYMNRDIPAETNAASGRYSRFRDLHVDHMHDGVMPPAVMFQANLLSLRGFGRRIDGGGEVVVNTLLRQRQRVALEEVEGVQFPNGAELGIWTLHHTFTGEPGTSLGTMTTRVGMRLI